MLFGRNEYKEMVWKNGNGITFEIDRFPKNDKEDFQWRLSMAIVKYPGGPFSFYPNIDRSLAIFHGKKILLKINNEKSIHLNETSVPYSFAGETSIECEIFQDEITDFNVMTNRKYFQHKIQRLTLNRNDNPMKINNSNENILFFTLINGNLQMNQFHLTNGDTLKFDNQNQIIEISTLDEISTFFFIQIIPLKFNINESSS
ncbi:unnamed protein product [Adineta ricciae]|uniref:HutD-family protein n=1 Tax=Adineta ricciae TaxID=249248 RepID=A0A815FNL2_ADIRI|nr:unnamed protein product [Adineta ricciae]CAF1511917.1 unnamed protein product [Adineta ricciae]